MTGVLCFLIPALLLTVGRMVLVRKYIHGDGSSGRVFPVLYFIAVAVILNLTACFILKIGFVPKFSLREALGSLNREPAAAVRYLLTALFAAAVFLAAELSVRCGWIRDPKHILIVLFLTEGVILLSAAGQLVLTRGAQRSLQAEYEILTPDDGEAYLFCLPEGSHQAEGAPVYRFRYRNVPGGTYTVAADYVLPANRILKISCSQPLYLKANPIFLDHYQNKTVFYVTLTHPAESLTFSVLSDPEAAVTFDLNVTASRLPIIQRVLAVLILFTAAEIAFLYFPKHPESGKTAIALIGMSAAAFLPYMLKGTLGGHDFAYHMMRIEGIADAVRNGQFPVYLQPLWVGGYGSPVSMYYGDVLLYFPAFLRLIGVPATAAYKIFVFAVNFSTSVFAYYAFRNIFRSRRTGLILAFVYVCSPYRLADIYVRFAVGEYCAAMFLPLVCLGFYGICTEDPEKGRWFELNGYGRYAFLLAFGMSGVLLTHILTMEMTVILLVISALLLCRRLFTFPRLKALAAAVIQFVLMSLFFIVPFFDSYLSNDTIISRRVDTLTKAVQSAGIQPGEFFMFFKDIFGSGGDNALGDRMYLSPGIVLMTAVFAALYLILRKKGPRRLIFYTGMTLLCLWLSSDFFPWDGFAYYSRIGQFMAQMQFPWRYLILAAVFGTLVLGELIMAAETRRGAAFTGYLVAGICLLVLFEGLRISGNYASAEGRRIIYNTYESDISTIDPIQHMRYGTKIALLPHRVVTENVTCSDQVRRGASISLHCTAGEGGGTVTVPMLNYKGYRVTDGADTSYEIFDGENNEVAFRLPDGFDGRVTAAFRPVSSWTAAIGVSAVFYICCIITMAVSYRRKRSVRNTAAGETAD